MNLKQIVYALTIVGSVALSIQAYGAESSDQRLSPRQKRGLVVQIARAVRELPESPERTSLEKWRQDLLSQLSQKTPNRCSSWFGCCKRTTK